MVAAEAQEFDGLVRRLPRTARLNWTVEFACAGELNGDRWILVANGPGPSLAGEAAEAAFREEIPDAVVSTGLCGALDPQFEIGQIIVASEIIAGDQKYASQAPAVSRSYAHGPIISVDQVAVNASDKRSMCQSGACAVEMEAAGLAGRASNLGRPFYCVRAVSDLAMESLPLDFNQFRDKSGRFSRGRIALAAMQRPWARVPGLVRFARNSRRASEELGDFLADCRF
jgi:nucleoside phosphorylase